jgi:hypothetical protein
MTGILTHVPDEDRMLAEVDAALILDEALDLRPLDDREVDLDDDYRDEAA